MDPTGTDTLLGGMSPAKPDSRAALAPSPGRKPTNCLMVRHFLPGNLTADSGVFPGRRFLLDPRASR